MKLLPSFACVLLLVSCKKDDFDGDGLVPATQSGKNTGDFLLNGQPYRPGRWSASPGQAVGANWYYIRGGRQVTIFFSRIFEREDSGVNIVLPRIVRPGSFLITAGVSPVVISGNQPYLLYSLDQPSPARHFLTGPTAIGRVEVTRYDTVAHIISGTFEAKLREYNGPDSLAITKGRFDCKF